uniref:Uncharacterized protein n=1 Tax=Ciona intestinalis TaxID=7719 RepID=H2XLY2_CIOIN
MVAASSLEPITYWLQAGALTTMLRRRTNLVIIKCAT